MKRIISSILVFVFLLSITIVPIPSATVDNAGIGNNIELSETGAVSAERQKVVDYMMAMATVEWKCGKQFQCANWDIFYANQTYYGIPYDQAANWNTTGDCVDMNEFNNMIKGGKSINGRIGRSDCSSTVSLAMRQVDKSVKITGTSYMYPGANGFIAVGDYSFKTNTVQTCLNNGKTKMFNAYKFLQPGDCIVHNGNYKNNKGETVYIGHAILIVGNNPSKETVTVVHQSSGNYVYNPKTKTCWSRGPSDYSRGIINNTLPRNSSWGVNCEIKYSSLYSDYYIPLTCKVLANSSPSTIVKPSVPSSVSLNSTALGKGDTLVASWGKVSGATKYNVKVFCNGKQKDSKSITGTSYSYKANDEGTYYVTVSASNSAGTSSEKKSGNATVYPNYTVKWVDYDGSVLKTQSVKYGGNGTNPPANPVREGYVFQSWSGSPNNIKKDTTITATYKINSYLVSFVDYNGSTIGSAQRVDHGKSATAPEDVPVQAGFKFIGWNTEDYKSVTKSMTVSAVYEWENTDLPIGMNITSAKRNEEGTGYVVTVDLNNFPNDFTKGKIVVALKTDVGKMVASETRTISLPESNKCTEKITVLYSGLVKNVEVSMVGVVDDETTGTPKAKTVRSAVDIGNEWSVGCS